MAGSSNRQRLKDINNTGFGPNSSVEGGRLINPDGSTNLRKTGIPIWERISIYHTLLRMRRPWFVFWIFIFYTSLNILFGAIYFILGVEHLAGSDYSTLWNRLTEAFFFSSQTLTTVGYGRVAPTGFLTNCVASFESLLGIISFAVVTGLIYGRFSRPRAYLLFSKNIIIAPYKDGRALMVRVASYKNNHLTDLEAQFTLALHDKEHGKAITKFYPLKLELAKINSLALSWTMVHHINDESPLYQLSHADLQERKLEVIVILKGFDDHFSNVVQQRTSYTNADLLYGVRFLPMFERDRSGKYTLLELDKINAHEHVTLPSEVPAGNPV